MDAKYYVAVRAQTNDHHSVHKEGCPFLPGDEMRIFLGVFNSNQDAIEEARQHFISSNGCQFCSKDHKACDEEIPQNEVTKKDTVPSRSKIPFAYHQIFLCSVN